MNGSIVKRKVHIDSHVQLDQLEKYLVTQINHPITTRRPDLALTLTNVEAPSPTNECPGILAAFSSLSYFIAKL